MRLQAQIMDMIKQNKLKKETLDENQELAINARFDKVELDIGQLNEKIEKTNYDLSMEIKIFQVLGCQEKMILQVAVLGRVDQIQVII